MSATPEQLAVAREKAKLSLDNGKRGKGKKTIAKERARELYEQKMLEYWDSLTEVQRQQALKAENVRERVYVIDQTIGKPIERHKAETEIDIELDI